MPGPDVLIEVRHVDLVIPEEGWGQENGDVHECRADALVIGDDWKGGFGGRGACLPRAPEVSVTRVRGI